MADVALGPDNPSSDYQAMSGYWAMIEAINGGAVEIRKGGESYLPKCHSACNIDPLSRGIGVQN